MGGHKEIKNNSGSATADQVRGGKGLKQKLLQQRVLYKKYLVTKLLPANAEYLGLPGIK
jgi:hypothetical protein